jgi:glycosyltransferase involved in cell wall biosynthesis
MNEELPLVSVVTPSLNQGRYVEETIRSVADQDYPRVEHIVVDGGSTDGTLEILGRYPQVRWTSEPDEGQADAIAKGFRHAKGAILAWLNSDDLYLPGAIAAAVEALSREPCGLVYGGWRQIDEHGATLKDVPAKPWDYPMLLEQANFVPQPSSFFTREAYETVGGIDTRYRYAMDHDLWLRIGARFEVCPLDRLLAAFRYHPESKSVAESDAFAWEVVQTSRRNGGRRLSPYYLDYYLPRRRPHVYRALLATRLLRKGDVPGLFHAARRRRSGKLPPT